MSVSAESNAAASVASAEMVCADCNSPASGNFCSNCGADLRAGRSGILGSVSSTARLSFPGTYLQILRSPIKATVALADDPIYRQHISFFFSGLAVFCVIMVPFIMQAADPTGAMARYSESMQTLVRVLSQVGVYVGALITFLLGYALFYVFAKTPRRFRAYLKLYCLAFGFMLPLYALYDYVARGMLGITGMSSFSVKNPTLEEVLTVPFAVALGVSLLIWVYFIAIHRRFWNMPVWKAGLLYTAATLTSQQAGYYVMLHAGYWITLYLIKAGVVSV